MFNMFGVFELVIGVYVLYSAITGKGQLLRNEHVKKGMEKLYIKRMRIMAAILAPVMLALGGLDVYNSSLETPVMMPLFTGLMISAGVLIAVMLVISVRMTDRKKPATPQKPGGGKAAPRAAFEFDEEDTN